MQSERRRRSGAPPRPHLREHLQRKIAAVALFQYFEAFGDQQFSIARGVFHKAHFGTAGPGDRIVQISGGEAHHVVNAEYSGWRQNPPHFAEQLRFVFDVHADVEHVRPVEAPRRERQVQRATLLAGYTIAQTHPRRQRIGYIGVLRGQIDSRDPATMFSGEIARSPAQPAAYVEQPHPRLRSELLRKRYRRQTAADMKLIHRRQVFRSQMI